MNANDKNDRADPISGDAMSVRGQVGGKVHREPSLIVGTRYLRLRTAAVDKLPENFIGYYLTYDTESKLLKIRAVKPARAGLVSNLSEIKRCDRRLILATDVMKALLKDGIEEMLGEWDEAASEFVFTPVT